MVALNPDGEIFSGVMGDPDVYCMTASQLGELLAAAFMKANDAFVQALMFYMVIALIIGFLIGAGFMYLYLRKPKSTGDED